MVEAKAKAKATEFCPRGVLEVEASPRGHPSLGFFYRASYAESGYAKSSVCPSLVRLCMNYEVLYLWY